MSKMLENASTGFENLSDEIALLDGTDVDGLDADVAALYEYLPELGLENDFEGMGALGAARKRRKGRKGRRLSKATRRKLRRVAKGRKRRKSGRFAGLEAKSASKSEGKGLGAAHRRRKGRRVKKATLRRRGKRIAKKMKRSKRSGRFIGLKGLGLEGLGDDYSMGLPDYGSEGLGALAGKTRRKGRKARKAGRKGRRKGRKGRKSARRSANLGYIANVADGLAAVEVEATMPVVGAFQWLATAPGMEALGGVALAPLVGAVVAKLLNFIPGLSGQMGKPMGQVATSALTAIGMWELGKGVGSPNIAKFGAFYALGRLVETQITNPFILNNVAMNPFKNFGLGTYREDDMSPIGDTVRIPDGQELVGIGDTVRVPDTATIGQVGDTVRVPDTSTIGADDDVDGIGDDDVDGFGQEMIPDTSMEGAEEEAEMGAEDSDLF